MDSGSEGVMISSEFVRANRIPKFELEKPIVLQLACIGSQSVVQYGTTTPVKLGNEKHDEYFDIANVDFCDTILGTPFLHHHGIQLDFKANCARFGDLKFPNRFGGITPTEADEAQARLHIEKSKPKVSPKPTTH